jgi:DNA-binding response OmpR family regulator
MSASPSPSRGAILIVEDDLTFAAYLRKRLNRAGYDVDLATDGLSALIQLRRAPPDLVILDLALPAVDGLSVLRSLRADPAIAGVPVIILTGRYSAADVEQATALGVADYLVKPTEEDALLASIARRIARRDGDSVVFLER